MKKIPWLALFFLLSSCGIEGPTSTISLFPPNGMKVIYINAASRYLISFQGLNPEAGFSGYNLYYTTDSTSAELGQGQKITLKNTVNGALDPTFVVTRPFTTVTTFNHDLDQNQMPEMFFATTGTNVPANFYFFVRAYDRSAARESVSSLAVRTLVQ